MANFLTNKWLGLKYMIWKDHQKKVDFGVPAFTEDFDHPSYLISDRNPYSTDMITLKENVEVKDGKLLLHTKYENRDFSNWWGNANKLWSIGYIEYINNAFPFGIWSVKCKLPDDKDAWPAVWLLRERHPVAETKIELGEGTRIGENQIVLPGWKDQRVDLNWYIWFDDTTVGFVSAMDKSKQILSSDKNLPDPAGRRIFVSPDHIIPEVDFMEIINKKLQHTIHFGYSNVVYRTTGWNVRRGKPDLNKEYEFSVELTSTGYKFYIDRVLTGVLTREKAVANAPAYLILNNAKHNHITSGPNSVFEISEVKFYPKPL